MPLKYWKALNELQAASRCCIFFDDTSAKCVFKVTQLQDTWDQHEVDWAFEVLSDAVKALAVECSLHEMKKRGS